MTSRRRFAAAFAALVGLVAVLVFGGVMAAQALLGLTITTTGGVYDGNPFEIAGTATNGPTDNQTPINIDVDGAPGCLIGFAANWGSCYPGIVDPGSYTVTAYQEADTFNGWDARDDEVTFIVAPPEPTYVEGNRTAWDGQTLDFNGTTTAPNSTVTVSIPGAGTPCTDGPYALVGSAWNCSFDLVEAYPDDYTISVTQTSGGVTGAAETATLTVLPGDDGLYISAPLSSAPAGTPFTINGTKNPEVSGVIVRAGPDITDPILCNIAPSADPTWTCSGTIADPGYTLITAYQGARVWENPVAVGTFALAPTVDNPDPDEISYEDGLVPGFTVSGTASYLGSPAGYGGDPGHLGSYVRVETVGGWGTGCSSPITDDGTDYVWSCTFDFDDLDAGFTYDYFVQQSDYGGMTSPQSAHYSVYYGLPAPGELEITAPIAGENRPGMPDTKITGRAPNNLDPIDLAIDGVIGAECTGLTVDIDYNWRCDIDLDEGPHTVQAWQYTESTPVVSFTVDERMPAPDPDDYNEWFTEGTTDAVFTGTTTYPGAPTRISVIEDLGDGFTEVVAETVCSDNAGHYECHLDLSGLDEGGWYEFEAVHLYPPDHEITGYVAIGDLNIGDEPPGPNPGCSFRPAGVSISGAGTGWTTELQAVFPNDDGYTMEQPLSCGGYTGYDFTSRMVTTDLIAECDPSCARDGLAPGYYTVYVDSIVGSTGIDSFDHVFRVPETPTISAAADAGNRVLMRGTATAGDTVRVERPNGSALCTTTATSTGRWSCSLLKSATSSVRVIAVDPASGGMSARTPARTIPVFVPEDPETPIELVSWFLEFGGDFENLKPGDRFTISVSGMPAGTDIEVWMHSTPRLLGDGVGTGLPMEMELTVPLDAENGQHEIQMIGTTPLGTKYFFTSDATVVGGIDPPPPLKEQPVLGDKPGGSGTGDRTDPAAPSGLSDGLAPVSVIASNPVTIAIAGGLALALLFLVALPTELLNSSLSSNSSRLGRAYGAVDGALTKAQDWFVKVTRSRAIAAVILTTIVAIIYGFVDPGFGFDIVSLRLVLSLAIAFFLLSFVASWISGIIIRRAWGAIGVIEMQPTIILFAVVGVIVARVLDFSPGFLVGIAIGLELLQASRTVSAKAIFVQIGVVTGLALAAWGIYSAFTPGNDFVGMLVEDTMVAVTAEGLTGALIALFPLKFLDGHDLWAVSKRLWVTAFLIVATAFALLVLPTAIQGTDVRDYGVWLLVFAVFGLISLAVWLIFVRADKKAAAAEKETVDA